MKNTYEYENRLKPATDIIMGIIVVIGAVVMSLIYNRHFRGIGGIFIDFLNETKVITFVLLIVLMERLFYRLLSRHDKLIKYICAAVLTVIPLSIVFVFNNLLHYWWTIGIGEVDLYVLMLEDLTYRVGMAEFRYIALYILGFCVYAVIESEIYLYVGDLIVEFLVEHCAGLLEFFGVEFDDDEYDDDYDEDFNSILCETVTGEERQDIIERLQKDTEIEISRFEKGGRIYYSFCVNLPEKENSEEIQDDK